MSVFTALQKLLVPYFIGSCQRMSLLGTVKNADDGDVDLVVVAVVVVVFVMVVDVVVMCLWWW